MNLQASLIIALLGLSLLSGSAAYPTTSDIKISHFPSSQVGSRTDRTIPDNDKSPSYDSVPAIAPEYRDYSRNDLTSNIPIMNFDSLGNGVPVQNSYTNVEFSTGFTTTDTSSSIFFPPHTGNLVAYSNEIANTITFTNPVERFLGRYS